MSGIDRRRRGARVDRLWGRGVPGSYPALWNSVKAGAGASARATRPCGSGVPAGPSGRVAEHLRQRLVAVRAELALDGDGERRPRSTVHSRLRLPASTSMRSASRSSASAHFASKSREFTI